MQDDSDLTDADRVHEGYQHRYEKERRASYMLVLFGLLAIVAVVIVMFMHRYTSMGTNNLANVEPAAGSNTTQVEENVQENPSAPTRSPTQVSPDMVQPKGDNPPQ